MPAKESSVVTDTRVTFCGNDECLCPQTAVSCKLVFTHLLDIVRFYERNVPLTRRMMASVEGRENEDNNWKKLLLVQIIAADLLFFLLQTVCRLQEEACTAHHKPPACREESSSCFPDTIFLRIHHFVFAEGYLVL